MVNHITASQTMESAESPPNIIFTPLFTPPPSTPSPTVSPLRINPFTIPKIQPNTWRDSLRGMNPAQKALMGPWNKAALLANFQEVIAMGMKQYNASFPGDTDIPVVIFPEREGRILPVLHRKWMQLQYRFSAMELADRICEYLGLDMLPPIGEVDIEEVKKSDVFKEEWDNEMVNYATELVDHNEIFEAPSLEQGRSFNKPVSYLGLAVGILSKDEIDEVVEILLEMKKEANAKRGWKAIKKE